jgi:hypothetical protein
MPEQQKRNMIIKEPRIIGMSVTVRGAHLV